MLTGPTIIYILKCLVLLVTALFLAAIAAIATGSKRLHGQINTVFFILTMTTVVAFELLLRFGIDVTSGFSPEARRALQIHLVFAIPSAVLLPLMFWTGSTGRRRWHTLLAGLFSLFWLGTVITGIVFLPHE